MTEPNEIHAYYKKIIDDMEIKLVYGKITYLEREMDKLTEKILSIDAEKLIYENQVKEIQKQLDTANKEILILKEKNNNNMVESVTVSPVTVPTDISQPHLTPQTVLPIQNINLNVESLNFESNDIGDLLQFLLEQNRLIPSAVSSENPKVDLAYWCCKVGLKPPIYKGEKDGPDHCPKFIVRVYIHGIEIACGRGIRKTHAEVDAADMALKNLGELTNSIIYRNK
jgi:hypothetical protein